MAEFGPSLKNLESSKSSLPSNEELINSLVSSLEESGIKETSTPSSTDKCDSKEIKTNSAPDSTTSIDTNHTGENEKKQYLKESNTVSIDDESDKEEIPSLEDDLVDELALKDLESTYTDEDRMRLHKEAETFKQNGNELFKSGHYRESALAYTQALRTCPLSYPKDRAIFYSNRAAAKMKLELNESAIEDCTKALELDERYLKVLLRRAQLYESTDKLDEALEDYRKILEIDPVHREALRAVGRLPEQIQERNEKLKAEMFGKLKDLGNMFLKPFGLSTDSFQITQDPNSGGYSVNFKG